MGKFMFGRTSLVVVFVILAAISWTSVTAESFKHCQKCDDCPLNNCNYDIPEGEGCLEKDFDVVPCVAEGCVITLKQLYDQPGREHKRPLGHKGCYKKEQEVCYRQVNLDIKVDQCTGTKKVSQQAVKRMYNCIGATKRQEPYTPEAPGPNEVEDASMELCLCEGETEKGCNNQARAMEEEGIPAVYTYKRYLSSGAFTLETTSIGLIVYLTGLLIFNNSELA